MAAQYDANALAKLRNVSVRQLQRIFRLQLGRSPQEWLNEQRILAAQKSLGVGNPIKMVALDLGFKQSSHFCRQFKTLSGFTPSQFKETVATLDVAPG